MKYFDIGVPRYNLITPRFRDDFGSQATSGIEKLRAELASLRGDEQEARSHRLEALQQGNKNDFKIWDITLKDIEKQISPLSKRLCELEWKANEPKRLAEWEARRKAQLDAAAEAAEAAKIAAEEAKKQARYVSALERQRVVCDLKHIYIYWKSYLRSINAEGLRNLFDDMGGVCSARLNTKQKATQAMQELLWEHRMRLPLNSDEMRLQIQFANLPGTAEALDPRRGDSKQSDAAPGATRSHPPYVLFVVFDVVFLSSPSCSRGRGGGVGGLWSARSTVVRPPPACSWRQAPIRCRLCRNHLLRQLRRALGAHQGAATPPGQPQVGLESLCERAARG